MIIITENINNGFDFSTNIAIQQTNMFISNGKKNLWFFINFIGFVFYFSFLFI